jgi:hypothetical protein
MIYMKHPEHGNAHFPDEQEAALVADGWVKWPRTAEQKAGISAPVVPDAPAIAVKRPPGRPRKNP